MDTFRTKIKLQGFNNSIGNRQISMALVSGVARALCVSNLN